MGSYFFNSAQRLAIERTPHDRLRDLVERALTAEVALFPEQLVAFVDANQGRIEQVAGHSSWA